MANMRYLLFFGLLCLMVVHSPTGLAETNPANLAQVPAFAQIVTPEQDARFEQGVEIAVLAEASHPQGVEVARLWVNGSFYALAHPAVGRIFRDRFDDAGSDSGGSGDTERFEFNLSGLEPGEHTLMVRTRDYTGQALDSETISIFVDAPTRYTVITVPENGATISQGETLTVTAQAQDPVGISAVRLWINGVFHSLDSEAPYQFTVADLPVGSHNLMVRSRNADGEALDSEAVVITVEGQPAPEGAIVLPIEVLGPAGTQKSVAFELDDPGSITHLYLRCNACGYHEVDLDKAPSLTKASVRVNGGNPIALKHFIEKGTVYGNPQIAIIGGEADYGGIGGGFRTVRFTLPVSGLQSGENVLTFEHQDAVPPSIGFRIIELNLLEHGDLSQKVLPESAFVDDDPAAWAPPRPSAQDIDQGRELWHQRNILYDPWVDYLDGQGGGQGPLDGNIIASCAACHASDGRDLKYFNFSNKSIVERSIFHELSREQGEQIASYIRSLDIPVVDQARPWNPPYQPGPGLDSRTVYEWAAGAGMDAVLDRDSDMAPYLFPNGTSLNAVREVVDRYQTLNFRELPVNIPMPEWNQWLPIIHPDDAFDLNAAAIHEDERGDSVGMPFYERLFLDAEQDPTPRKLGALAFRIKEWLRRGQTCSLAGLSSGEPMRGLNGAVLDNLALPASTVTSGNCLELLDGDRLALEPFEIAKRGLTAWSSVKMWELIHGNDLEQEGAYMTDPVCAGGVCVDASESRGWVADGRNVFDRPPHFIGVGHGRKFFTQNPLLGIMDSSAWYHLNMILNPGYRETMPSHFAYTYTHVELLQIESGVDQGYRFWATMIKQRQLQTNGRYGVEAGLDLRTAQPYVYYGTARRTTRTDTQASVGQPLWRRLVQAMLEDFVADAHNATAADWANANQNRRVQPRYSTDFSPCGPVCGFDLGPYQGRNTYRVIPELRGIGVSESVIQDLIDWGEKTWPNGPWDAIR